MNGLIAAAIGRSRTVLATLVMLIVAGWFAYQGIPKESNPDIPIPIVYVALGLAGISPEDSERLLLRPMEQELRTVEGVKEMRSTAYQGGGNVVLEFEAGFDSDKATRDVRDRVDRAKSKLPPEADEPTTNPINLSLFPVLTVILSGEVPERTLFDRARELQDRIEAIPSVLKVDISGKRDELVEIVIDPLRMESYGIVASEVTQLFQRSNKLVAAGNVDTGNGRFAISVPGLIESLDDIWNMPIKVSGDAVVRFRDVAEIRRTFKDPETFARVDGKPAVALEVSKRLGENIIDTIERIRAVVETERAGFPAGLRISYAQDNSEEIKTMLGDLENSLVVTVFLVMVIVLATLGMRTTALVVVAVPGSFLTAMLVLSGLGYSINMVVLFGLILSAGNVVDGAIVVTEYADCKMAQGMDKRRAYSLAARRMAWPIIASTATQLAAFAPLLFWPGIVGEFMKYLPVSQFATLIAALVMALIFIPVLGAILGRPGSPVRALRAANNLDEDLDDESDPIEERQELKGWFVAVLRVALRHPAKVLLASLLILLAVWPAYMLFGKGVEFFPNTEPNNAAILVRARGNLSVFERDALVRAVERRVLELNEFDVVYTRDGLIGGQDLTEDTIGVISLVFKDWRSRRTADAILDDIRHRTAGIPGIVVEPRKEEGGPPTGKALNIQLSSRHPEILDEAVRHLRRGFDAIDGGQLRDIEDSRPLPGIEWQLAVDRAQAAKFGLDVSAVGDAVRLVTNGLKLGEYRPDDSKDEIDIVVRYPNDLRYLGQLDRVRVDTGKGPVPIENVVARTPQPMVGTIHRVDGLRVMTVRANTAIDPATGQPYLADTKVRQLREWLNANPVDPRVRADFKGADEEQAKSAAFLMKAFAAGMAIMAIILVTQFNSFYSAFLILTSVVLATIGVMVGLLITGQVFGIVMTGVGIIALAGTVVQNNIVLIDTYDQYKETEPSPYEAVLRTAAERARPVLLTAFNTVLSLLPLAFGVNIDLITRDVTVGAPSSQWWIQLSTAIVFGLSFATVLTLVVTPCALMIKANLHDWRVAKARAWTRRRLRRHRPARVLDYRDAAE
jgi:multidrug efflux pump